MTVGGACPSRRCGAAAEPPAWGHRAQRQRLEAAAETRQSASLSVVTAEGDRVTISIESIEKAALENRSGQKGAREINSVRASLESRMAVNIGVEGSLSEQEASDIAALLQELTGAAKAAEGAPFEVADSLANYAFSYSEESAAAYSRTGATVRRAGPRFLRHAA